MTKVQSLAQNKYNKDIKIRSLIKKIYVHDWTEPSRTTIDRESRKMMTVCNCCENNKIKIRVMRDKRRTVAFENKDFLLKAFKPKSKRSNVI